MQTSNGFQVIIASPPDYEDLVAEIYLNGAFIAQINKDQGDDAIELNIADGTIDQKMVCRNVNLKDFLEVIEIARLRLLGVGEVVGDDGHQPIA